MSGRRSAFPIALIAVIALASSLASAASLRPDTWQPPADPAAARQYADRFAWQLFIGLNLPVASAKRSVGVPRPGSPDAPAAWESWRAVNDIFLPHGADPGPWGAHHGRTLPATLRFEVRSPGALPNARHIANGVMVPLTDTIASARRLTEIRFNRLSYEYIRNRELYDLEGQLRACESGAGIEFPLGSMQVKAKWRPIDARDRDRYHAIVVRLADGSSRTYGLTGLHIAAKLMPDWFWATFEHVDNPTLDGAEGWHQPSMDSYACPEQPLGCDRAPAALGARAGVWQQYRLRGTMVRFVDEQTRPLRLANSELETGFQDSASCMTCHSRAALAVASGVPVRLPIFDMAPEPPPGATGQRKGFVGLPRPEWFEPAGGSGFQRQDFVWSLAKAHSRYEPRSGNASVPGPGSGGDTR